MELRKEGGMERTGTHQPVHLGVWYDFRNPVPWRIGWQQLYNETLDQARWAEELGFNGDLAVGASFH